MPDTAFEHAIAYVEEPTKDGRKIAPGGIDWQFGKRIPVTSGFEGGQVIGHAITSHIDDSGAVMATRSDEHTSELQSLMRISYAVFCLKTKHKHPTTHD